MHDLGSVDGTDRGVKRIAILGRAGSSERGIGRAGSSEPGIE
jgi:hypothetical protein